MKIIKLQEAQVVKDATNYSQATKHIEIKMIPKNGIVTIVKKSLGE
jgi:hypothetical protein